MPQVGKSAKSRTAAWCAAPAIATGIAWSARRWSLRGRRRCWKTPAGSRRSLASLLDEAITETDNRFDLASRRLQLSAQAADVHVHRAGLDRAFVAPDPLEQAIA